MIAVDIAYAYGVEPEGVARCSTRIRLQQFGITAGEKKYASAGIGGFGILPRTQKNIVITVAIYVASPAGIRAESGALILAR